MERAPVDQTDLSVQTKSPNYEQACLHLCRSEWSFLMRRLPETQMTGMSKFESSSEIVEFSASPEIITL